ncbi:MAG: M23 family metallopeptidase [Acidobacteriota bacterium]|nr:M23 family metallopeptidase [Acidobacteriota bacterium]
MDAIVLSPPLKGERWIDVDSCCKPLFRATARASKNYAYYGADILSASAGTVVEVVRNLLNQLPLQPPANITIESDVGNHVIVDMGNGRFATMYAHLVPGAPPCKLASSSKPDSGSAPSATQETMRLAGRYVGNQNDPRTSSRPANRSSSITATVAG